jgi:hypothetical protein
VFSGRKPRSLSRSDDDGIFDVATSLEALFWSHLYRVGCTFVSISVVCRFVAYGGVCEDGWRWSSLRGVLDGRRGSGPRWWMCVEAAVLGSMAGICFMGRSSCLHGWVIVLCHRFDEAVGSVDAVFEEAV